MMEAKSLGGVFKQKVRNENISADQRMKDEQDSNMNDGNRNALLQQVPQTNLDEIEIQAERAPNMNGENRNTLLQQVPQTNPFAMGIQPGIHSNMNGVNTSSLMQQVVEPTPPSGNNAVYGNATDVDHSLNKFFFKIQLDHSVSDKSVILNAFADPDKINIPNSSYKEGNNFRVVMNAGNGAFGTVDICQDNISKFKFAKKTIQLTGNNRKALSSIRREANALLWCNSEFIVKLIGIRVYPKDYYMPRLYSQIDIYLEYGGVSLKTYLTRNVPDLPEMLRTILQILYGIKYLHENNHAHTDLHAGNILIGVESGQVKLCDLGSVKPFGENLFTLSAGYTAAYFPPTVLKTYLEKENIVVTGRLDTFSAGKIQLEAVTGRINSFITVDEMMENIKDRESWEVFVQSSLSKILPPYRTDTIQWLIVNLMSYNTTIDAAAAIQYIHKNN